MTSRRNVYLKMKTLKEAREILFNRFPVPETFSGETIPVPDAVGRVLSEHVTARLSSPNFHAAAMDGIAVKAESTFGAHEASPRELRIGETAFYVNTGHVLPEHTNAVIMIENVQVIDEHRIEIQAPAYPWQHVRKMGEDIVATELLFTRDHVITPYCVGALLSAGIFTVRVRKKPKILIIPTGSELLDWQKCAVDHLKPGQVLETNSFVLGKLAESFGAEYVRHPLVKDDEDTIRNAVDEASGQDYDIIITVGGSSAGSEDYTRKIISDIGDILFHGVTIMPGKPVVMGVVNEKPVAGIPGYPVSAIVAFEQFVRPLIYRMQGLPEENRPEATVFPTRKISSHLGVEEFFRVKLGNVGDKIVATPLPRGSGSITTLTRADGIIRIPNHVEGLNVNEPVSAELLRPLSHIRNTIVAVGSHDNTLDVLADQIRSTHNSHLTLSSSHVGSMGGLMAIKRGVCHIAGCHLLDTETGTYNISYINKFLPGFKGVTVHLVERDQGLIVPKGNPKRIQGFEDLTRDDIIFINRQTGSGTRILLDYHLNRSQIQPDHITGYENDEFTHMSVAVAVLSGLADVGLGICAAANALDLDFIPVATEQYDLIIPEEHISSDSINVLLETIRSEAFKQRVQMLGGYNTQRTGDILHRFAG
ncbi:MAG: molybdopterin biosynthesis protein [Desulfobacterales bacterium]|nr:molybdopterin biosynthesis protein [Desulfobacterales bacterium]MDD4072879.1 molybdopterin biosynthesis protein [Desulfobacterales bacterium]MDD4392324.1 molybdopterin biosynthesis protein [Desulfobacterales bacterium]